jgi:hypothetical protein
MAQRLFEYAVLYHPVKASKKQSDNGDGATTQIIIQPTTLLAKDDQIALLMAARSIPAKYSQKLDRVEIVIRPF